LRRRVGICPKQVVHLSSALFEIPGAAGQSGSAFDALMDDLALVKLLGVRLVLVVSVRRQVDDRLAALGQAVEYVGDWQVTPPRALQVVKEMSGAARATVEARLSRSLRTPSGHNGAAQGVSVASGNLFFSTQPLGVRGGVDFGYAGDVRRVRVGGNWRRLRSLGGGALSRCGARAFDFDRNSVFVPFLCACTCSALPRVCVCPRRQVDTRALERHLAAGDVVLLTSLGYAASGEAYNVVSEALAAECAAALKYIVSHDKYILKWGNFITALFVVFGPTRTRKSRLKAHTF